MFERMPTSSFASPSSPKTHEATRTVLGPTSLMRTTNSSPSSSPALHSVKRMQQRRYQRNRLLASTLKMRLRCTNK